MAENWNLALGVWGFACVGHLWSPLVTNRHHQTGFLCGCDRRLPELGACCFSGCWRLKFGISAPPPFVSLTPLGPLSSFAPMTQAWALAGLIFLAALLYSSVGHG